MGEPSIEKSVTTDLRDGAWHYVVATYNETSAKILAANEKLAKIKKAKEVDDEIPF